MIYYKILYHTWKQSAKPVSSWSTDYMAHQLIACHARAGVDAGRKAARFPDQNHLLQGGSISCRWRIDRC